jgi:hypothetical protein
MSTFLSPPKTLPLKLGVPAQFGGLLLVPLFSTLEPRLECIGLDEATALGLSVTEVDDAGSVSTLLVTNPLDLNVLLFEGQELVGAKQNRILDRTIVVAANSKVGMPVSCVERGRWSYRSDCFTPAPRAAYPGLLAGSFQGSGTRAASDTRAQSRGMTCG